VTVFRHSIFIHLLYIYICILTIVGDVKYDMYLVALTVIEREKERENKVSFICFRTAISGAPSVTRPASIPLDPA